jgi:hypothetical protein
MISMTWPQYQRRQCSVDGARVALEGTWADVLFALLVNDPGKFMCMSSLIEAVYPDPDLEPDYAANVIFVAFYELRKLGIALENNWGVGWRIPASERGGKKIKPAPIVCRHGHEFTEENTLISPEGWRICRTCKRAAGQRRRAAQYAEAA